MKKFVLTLFIIFSIFSLTLKVTAQGSDGSVPPADPVSDPSTTPADPAPADPAAGTATPTPPVNPSPASTTTPAPSSGAVTPKPKIIPVVDSSNLPPLPMETPNNELAYEPPSKMPLVLVALGAVGLGILAFFGLNLRKKKEDKKDDKKCLNFKKLMEEKLNELTDLEGQLAGMAKDEVTKQVSNAVAGTKVGDTLIFIQNTKKEYDRLKKLYEECIAGLSFPKTTLLFLRKPQEGQILLAMKKRDFGKGKWNGIGGKLEGKENIKEALVREAKEEIGVKINGDDLLQVSTLKFSFKDKSDWNQEVHVFFAEKWEGEPVETEEMSPQWYHVDSMPYENMWVDDQHWLPLVLEGKKLNASFDFDNSGDKILNMKVKEI